jgi:hypothetical protein
MEYQLEIYRPVSCESSSGSMKVFNAAVPFQPIRVGDLLNTRPWGADAKWPLLRVLNVEHMISETFGAGIDPSGRMTHRLLIYTESVPDSAKTRVQRKGLAFLAYKPC